MLVDPTGANFGFEKGWFYERKMKDLARIVGQVLQN